MNPSTLCWALARVGSYVIAQASGGDAAPAPDPADVEVQSVWDFIVRGGPVMIPIALCSLVAFTVIVERLVSLRRSQVIPENFFPGLSGKLDGGAADRGKALAYCEEHASPVANIFGAGIKRLGHPAEVVEKHIQEAGEREVYKLRKYTRLLSVIAATAPLLGLLGTIFGMITAFQTVAASGDALGKTELLAKGIYRAMITTAAGLMLAIPVLIAYHWITAKVESLVAEMDRLTMAFMEDQVFSGGLAATAAPPQVAPPAVATAGESRGGNGRDDRGDVDASRVEPMASTQQAST